MVDGNGDATLNHGSCAATAHGDYNPWFAVKLAAAFYVSGVNVTNCVDCCGMFLSIDSRQ